jgi:hypothetical protein
MHVLLIYCGYLNFVWYICLVSSMVAGIDGGEGCSVGTWRDFISLVQVQVLCERISWWWSYKVERAFSGKSGNVVWCTKCPPDIQEYFLCELQRVRERKKAINDERLN